MHKHPHRHGNPAGEHPNHQGCGCHPAAKESVPVPPSEKRYTDPVCGMRIAPDESMSFTYKGTKYYFCSDDDLEKFKQNPEKYVHSDHQH